MKLPIRSPIYKLTRDLKPLLSPDLRVLEDFEVLELLLCIATWHALPCLPLIAPLFASVSFLGYLCVFSCMPQLAPMSVSAHFLVYFYVHCCRPLCIYMFGRPSSWAVDVETTCSYCSLLEVLSDKGIQVLCLFGCHESSHGNSTV